MADIPFQPLNGDAPLHALNGERKQKTVFNAEQVQILEGVSAASEESMSADSDSASRNGASNAHLESLPAAANRARSGSEQPSSADATSKEEKASISPSLQESVAREPEDPGNRSSISFAPLTAPIQSQTSARKRRAEEPMALPSPIPTRATATPISDEDDVVDTQGRAFAKRMQTIYQQDTKAYLELQNEVNTVIFKYEMKLL